MTTRPDSAHWWSLGVVLLVTVLYAFNFTQSVVLMDTARDLFKATDIARFSEFPALGPDIGGFFHTGPVWFYFLSLPALTGSLVVVAWWVGLFAALKFYLAYRLGTALLDWRFGLLWALMLLMPGWQVINVAFISHFNLLECLALLLLLLLYRFDQQGHMRDWYLAAWVVGLGFHAHPSFLVLGLFYLPLLWRHRTRLNWVSYLTAMGLFLLPLLPYLIDQIWHQWPDWQRWIERSSSMDQSNATGQVIEQLGWWQHVLATLHALVWTGPQRVLQFVLAHKPGLGQLMTGLYWLVVVVLLMGAWRLILHPKHRRWFAVVLLSLLLGVVLVTQLRSFTPFYMLLSLTPLLAGLMALCVYSLAARFQPLMVVLTLALVLLGSLPFFAFHQASKHGQVNLGPVMNVNQSVEPEWIHSKYTLDAITIKESRATSTLFCDHSTVINGPFASVLEMTGGALVHFFCDRYELQLGGQAKAGQQSLFMMHKSFWDRMGRQPDQWIAPSWGITTRHQNHAPDTAVKLVPFNDYVHPPRTAIPAGTVMPYTHHFVTEQPAQLVISFLLPTRLQFAVDAVTANGQSLKPVMQNAVNWVYHCADCGHKTRSMWPGFL